MRRIYRTIVAALGVALLVAVAVLAACITPPSGGLNGLGSDCATTLCCQTCDNITVDRVIDGDTFVSGPLRVRLFGVDTPEAGQRCSSEATG